MDMVAVMNSAERPKRPMLLAGAGLLFIGAGLITAHFGAALNVVGFVLEVVGRRRSSRNRSDGDSLAGPDVLSRPAASLSPPTPTVSNRATLHRCPRQLEADIKLTITSPQRRRLTAVANAASRDRVLRQGLKLARHDAPSPVPEARW